MGVGESIKRRNSQIAALLESSVTDTINSMKIQPEYLKPRKDTQSDSEFIEMCRANRAFLDLEETKARNIETIERENLRDYFKLLEQKAKSQNKLENTAYFLSGRDYFPAETIDTNWTYIDQNPIKIEDAYATAQDARKTGLKDQALDLLLIKAPGQYILDNEEEILSEAYRVLDDNGVLAASDAYITEPNYFKSLESLEPEPAIFTRIFDDTQSPMVRNMEGTLELYTKY